jgi:RNA polymerase sigma-70 factor (ECF subfamily)
MLRSVHSLSRDSEVMILHNLDELYRQHADTVYRYLRVKTGSEDLSEELTQETFFQAVRSIDTYDGSCQFSTWLIGIAKNVLHTHDQKNRHQALSLEEVPEQRTPSAEDAALAELGMEDVLAVIHSVPEPGREILYLRLLGNLSFRQIGAILNQSENWARVNFYRAKQSVVKELKQNE